MPLSTSLRNLDAINSRHRALFAQNHEAQRHLDAFAHKLTDSNLQTVAARKALSETTNKFDALRLEHNERTSALTDLQCKCTELETRCDVQQQQMREMHTSMSEGFERESSLQQTCHSLRVEMRTLQHQHTTALTELQSSENEVVMASPEYIAGLENELKVLTKSHDHFKTRAELSQGESDMLKMEMGKLTSEHHDAIDGLTKSHGKVVEDLRVQMHLKNEKHAVEAAKHDKLLDSALSEARENIDKADRDHAREIAVKDRSLQAKSLEITRKEHSLTQSEEHVGSLRSQLSDLGTTVAHHKANNQLLEKDVELKQATIENHEAAVAEANLKY